MSIVRGLLAADDLHDRVLKSRRDLLLTAIAFAGAMDTFDLRPSSTALLFVVLAISARTWVAHAIIAALWINVHPSAILAPGIAALSTRRAAPVIASALALLINPHGWRAIAAPIELLSFVSSGAFVNCGMAAEQLRSSSRCSISASSARSSRSSCDAMKKGRGGARCSWPASRFWPSATCAIRGLFFAAFPLLMPRFEIRRVITISAAACGHRARRDRGGSSSRHRARALSSASGSATSSDGSTGKHLQPRSVRRLSDLVVLSASGAC
jgi:hypothetical protein